MNATPSEADLRQVIDQVEHPAIARTLVDLGIVRDIVIEGAKVDVTFALPFPNIPIKDQLINSIALPLRDLGAEVDVKTTVMSEPEVQSFLAMEQKAWKGGI